MTGGDTVLDAFPHPSITPLEDKPTYLNLLRFCEKLIENAASVSSPLGGSSHGHSGLILPDANYFRDTGHHFVMPVFPGVILVVAATATAAAGRAIHDVHASDLRVFTSCMTVENATRKKIVSVIPDLFLELMKLPITGLATVAVRDILGQLFATHGKITSAQLKRSYESAKEPWDATTPFQVLSARIKKAPDLFAAAEEPFSDQQMIGFGYDAVLKTGVFSEALRVWRRKAIGLKTWINFQTFMDKKYNDYMEDQSSEDHHPFAGAAVQADTLAALQKVVEVMTSNREDIEILSETKAAYESKISTF